MHDPSIGNLAPAIKIPGIYGGGIRKGPSDAIYEGDGPLLYGRLPPGSNLTVYRAWFAYALRGSARLLPEDGPIGPGIARGRSSAVR